MYGTSENSVLLSVDIILDGFHDESFGWLPKSRGLLVETIIGENLENGNSGTLWCDWSAARNRGLTTLTFLASTTTSVACVEFINLLNFKFILLESQGSPNMVITAPHISNIGNS